MSNDDNPFVTSELEESERRLRTELEALRKEVNDRMDTLSEHIMRLAKTVDGLTQASKDTSALLSTVRGGLQDQINDLRAGRGDLGP